MEIQLNGPQSLAHQALRPGNNVCAPWGRGVGKSWHQRLTWYTLVAQHDGIERTNTLQRTRGIRIVHIMPTFKACKDIHKDLTLADLEGGGEWAWLGAKIDRTSWQISFPGGSWIKWFGAREANASRGIRCDVVTADEGDDIDPGVLDSVIKPWFTEPWSLRMRLLGGTPRRGRYGLLWREHRAGLDGAVARTTSLEGLSPRERIAVIASRRNYSFHASYRDAPETVDPDYAEEQRAEYERAGKLAIFRREWDCDFDSAEGLVYPMFDPHFHVREPPENIRFSEFLVGVDFGWNDPGVYLTIGVQGQGQDAVLWVLDEVYATQRDNAWWDDRAREILAKFGSARWYCDTSRPDRIADLKKLGARAQDFDKGTIEGGVMAVANMLAIRDVASGEYSDADPRRESRIYIHPHCESTISELGKYRRRRDPRNTESFLDDIEDKWNHANDSLRYCVIGRFGGVERTRHEYGAGW